MSKRVPELILKEMIAQIDAIIAFTGDIDKDTFMNTLQIQYATDRAFEILGEACKQLPGTFIINYPQVEWHKVIAFRNLLIHEYFRVERNIQWNIIHLNLPQLKIDLTHILQEYTNT